ncbi:MAG: replicative DNA helicase [Planctomycetes bacterium]|nr:replicative DNA helicase [Planctomycetota bacterium]
MIETRSAPTGRAMWRGGGMAANPVAPADVLLDHVPPNSPEAEMACLGAMIADSTIAGEVIEAVEPNDFYHGPHQIIYMALQELFVAKRNIDMVLLKDELARRGKLDEVGGVEYLMSLVEQFPLAINGPKYAQIVRDKAVLRQLLNACNAIKREVTQVHEDPDIVLDKAQQLIFEAVSKKGGAKIQKMYDILKETFLKISDIRERKDRCLGVPTGYHVLDDMLSGLQPSQMYIIAARPSVGKSSLAMCIAERVSVEQNQPVLFFSLEMSAQMISTQMLCSRARVNSHNLRRGVVREEEYAKLLQAAGKLGDAPLFIDDSSNLGILEIRARARRMKAEHDVKLIVVDYLQFVHAKADSREREVAIVSNHLKSLSKDLEVPVLVLAQLNRNPEGRDDRKPRLSDLRESGSIEQDADVVMLLSREVVQDPNSSKQGVCDVIVAKNRTGPTGEAQLAFIPEWTRFENLSVPTSPPPV